jgi:hypothetical protein
MADFVIKPGAGVSNKLILQTQDATDVLTTSASGVTLASATLTAPTIADLSNVTGTLSHGTTLQGWVDTSNTGVTFPAGSVVQTVTNICTTSSSVGSTVASAWIIATNMAVSITPKYNNSKILLSFVAGGMCATYANDIRVRVTGTATAVVCSQQRYGYRESSTQGWIPLPWAVTCVDTPATIATQTYQLYIAQEVAQADTANYRINPDATSTHSTNGALVTAMEIKI